MTASIQIDSRGLMIRDLLVRDQETVGAFHDVPEDKLVDDVQLALRLGAMMMARADVSVQSDYVDRRMQEIIGTVDGRADGLLREMEATLARRFDPAEADSLIAGIRKLVSDDLDPVRQVAKVIHDQHGQLDASLNPSNAEGYTGRMLKRFAEVEARFASMFDPANRQSFPSWIEDKLGAILGERLNQQLGEMQQAAQRQLQAIREDIAKMQAAEDAVAEVTDKTPLKGVSFENHVRQLLESVAMRNGDTVADTTTAIGEVGGSKKGDFTYDIGADEERRIVIECKNSPMTSCPRVLESMKKTLANRRAAFCIYVTRDAEQLQPQIGGWQIYRDRRVIITHADMLEPSLRVARLMIDLEDQAVDGIDGAAVEAQLGAITSAAARSAQAKTKLTNIEDAVSSLRELEDERRVAILKAIGHIRDELAKACRAAA